MKNFVSIVSLIICAFLISCEGVLNSGEDTSSTVFYSNSFESAADLTNWKGITTENLRNEGAPSSGLKSVYISGGCVAPHASLMLNSPGIDIHVSIRCYAKDLDNGGSVELYTNDQWITISVENKNWEFYAAEKSIIWKADEPLLICMTSGGFGPSAMLVDQLQVIKTF